VYAVTLYSSILSPNMKLNTCITPTAIATALPQLPLPAVAVEVGVVEVVVVVEPAVVVVLVMFDTSRFPLLSPLSPCP